VTAASAGRSAGAHAFPAWPGANEAAVAQECAALARRLVASDARAIGVLPAAGSPNLGPLLVRLASALAGFVGGRVGVVPRWRSWAKDPGGADGEHGDLRLRTMGPDVVAIVPPTARDSRAAALALQPILWELPQGVARVLFDLSGYGEQGAWPGAGVLADGVVVAVPARVARASHVGDLLRAIPDGKCIGTILIG
jgi:hypothetical protein